MTITASEISQKYVLYTALADLTDGKGELSWNGDVLSKLVKAMGVEKPITVQSLLAEMEKAGYIKRTRKADGRSIDTVRLVNEPPIEKMSGRKASKPVAKMNGASPTGPAPSKPVAVRINTPMLDEYRAAKETAERSDNKWLKVEFTPDPLAEEYLNIYNSHVRIVEKFNTQTAQLAEANRALEFFRKTRDGGFTQALKDAGVSHGD